ncbi:MAG: hypothetical protein BGO55_14300 [Sphingobacteriales bacterium 50-39]|nr:hypothetical protein [Sphingobacteriales bacterium]OJW57460.1 MAG: hypothetical protein BGO55_14300 [Sphingobacteriales bacterium 50-39]
MQDSLSGPDPDVVFGPLFGRLHNLQRGTFDYTIHRREVPNPQDVFMLKSSTALSYLEEVLSRVRDTKENLDSIVDALDIKPSRSPAMLESPFEGGSPIQGYENKDVSQVKAETKEALAQELDVYQKELTILRDKLEDIPNSTEDDPDKIQLNLSVVELGALIHLLKEAGLILGPNNTQLMKILSKFLQTRKGKGSWKTLSDAMRLDSMTNDPQKMNDRDRALEFWNDKLVEMQKIIVRLEKKYSDS